MAAWLGGDFRGEWYMYMYGWVPLLYTWNYHSIVKQLCAQALQSCPTVCDPMDFSPPGSSVHGVLQARILKWVALPFSRGSSQPRDWTTISCFSCTASRFFTTESRGKSTKWLCAVLCLATQSCPTLFDPTDCNPPGSSVRGFSRKEYWSVLPHSNTKLRVLLKKHIIKRLQK